jgi:co-chaperonin GroES (HSP10)
MTTSFQQLPLETKALLSMEFHYPALTSEIRVYPGCKQLPHSIRPNRLLIRPFQPKGLTAGGVYLERSDKHPPTWGHVLACHADNEANLKPGDMVMFDRYTEEVLYSEKLSKPSYPGEEGEVAVLHIRSVIAIITPPVIEVTL